MNILYPRECLIQHDPDERPTRPEKDTYAISPSGHFYIHYDTTDADNGVPPDLTDNNGNGIPDYVDEVSVIADSAHHVLVDVLGYEVEPFDGEGGYDIFIKSFAAGFYGFCKKDNPSLNSDGQTSWVEIDNDYLGYDMDPLLIMAVSMGHEYFHATQMGYKPNLYDTYFFEMLSMWFEDVLVPNGNDYLNWIGPLFSNTTAAFGTSGALGYVGVSGECTTTGAEQQGLYGAKPDVTATVIY